MHSSPQIKHVTRQRPNPTNEFIFAKKFQRTPAKTIIRQTKLISPIKYSVMATASEKHESINLTKNNFSGDIAMHVKRFFIFFLLCQKRLCFAYTFNMQYNTIFSEKCKIKKATFARFQENVLIIAIFLVMFCILSNSALYAKSVTNGIKLFFVSVLPGLLPFMFLCKIITNLNFEKLSKIANKPMQKLFGIGGDCFYAFFMSLVSGYPIGSKITADLFMQGKISKKDSFLCAVLSSTSGLIFIIGSVGTGMLNSPKLGIIIYVSSVISAVVSAILINLFAKIKQRNTNKKLTKQANLQTTSNSLIKKAEQSTSSFKNLHANKYAFIHSNTTSEHEIANFNQQNQSKNNFAIASTKTSKTNSNQNDDNDKQNQRTEIQVTHESPKKNFLQIMSSSAFDTAQSLLVVCFYIAFFFVLIDILNQTKILHFFAKLISPLFGSNPEKTALSSGVMSGIIEMTRGVKMLSNVHCSLSFSLISSLISFGGFSIIFQSLSFLSKTNIKVSKFIFAKFVQAFLSFFVCLALLSIFKF